MAKIYVSTLTLVMSWTFQYKSLTSLFLLDVVYCYMASLPMFSLGDKHMFMSDTQS